MAKPLVAIFQLAVLGLMAGAFFANWTTIHDQIPKPMSIDLSLISIDIKFGKLENLAGDSKNGKMLGKLADAALTVGSAAMGDHTGLMAHYDGVRSFDDFKKKACDEMNVGDSIAQLSGLKSANSCMEATTVVIIAYSSVCLLGLAALSILCSIIQVTAGGLINPRHNHIFAMIAFICVLLIFLLQGGSGMILMSMFDVPWMFFPGMGMFFGFFSCLLMLFSTCMACVVPENEQKGFANGDAEYGAAGYADPNQQYADPNQQGGYAY